MSREKETCRRCNGNGTIPCPGCTGTGKRSMNKDYGQGTQIVNCAGCHGTGSRTCGVCGGTGQQ